MSLFTVEQLELIRRLKTTGINAEAVLEAFRTLDELERELEVAARQVQSLSQIAMPSIEPSSTISSPPVIQPTNHLPQAASPPAPSPILLQALRAQNPVPLLISTTSPLIPSSSPERPMSIQTAPIPSTASESPHFSYESPSSFSYAQYVPGTRPVRSLRTPMKEITTLDDPQELEDFMKQGEEGCINDMKQFITQYSLRQTTVAMMTGVSQPYISKLLNGNHRELSLRCRKNIYSWYLNCRRHPEKLAAFLADPASRLETNGDGELVPQRRERYVFRPILIRMLEQFFAQTPFPDLTRRMEIANACNAALKQDKKGVNLMPKEVVSPQVVANWFANKRKELRRKSNEEANKDSMMLGSTPTTPGVMPTFPLSAFTNGMQGTGGDSAGKEHQESPSCSDLGSTPSPLPDETTAAETARNATMDFATLASRLGIGNGFPLNPNLMLQMPNPPSSLLPTSEAPTLLPNLASQLLGAFPLLISGNTPTTLPSNDELQQLLNIHQNLLKIEQHVE